MEPSGLKQTCFQSLERVSSVQGTVFLESKWAEVTWTSLWDPAENQSRPSHYPLDPSPRPICHVLVLTKHTATSFPIPVAVLSLLVRVRKKNHEGEQLKAPHRNWPFLGSACFSRPSACLRDPPPGPMQLPEAWRFGARWMIMDSMET